MGKTIKVNSEIGKLKTVLLKRPGRELENLTPATLNNLLFDDIPYLKGIQQEHDQFAKALADNGAEVLYLEKLLGETLQDPSIKYAFIQDILSESKPYTYGLEIPLSRYLSELPLPEMIQKVMSGIRKDEANVSKGVHLYDIIEKQNFFYLDPLPNLYFTRDPAAVIGNGIMINRMNQPARRSESMFMEYIVKHHPRFSKENIPIWLGRHEPFSIEGGDTLMLSSHIVAVGISERTAPHAIENLAKQLFKRSKNIKKVLAIEIKKTRAFMHLDTVFTMVDREIFTIHPAILGEKKQLNVYILEAGDDPNHLQITHQTDLEQALKEALSLSEILMLPCGGGDVVAAAREQWNDGSNTLAIAPGTVITYDRNYLSNDLMRQNGINVIEIPGSELVRGRGGPRCMSMPLYREDL